MSNFFIIMEKKLRFLPEYNAFGIEKEELACVEAPVLTLSDECYEILGLPKPEKNAPKVGFLMGVDGVFNTIDIPYAYAMTLTNMQIVALDYAHGWDQLKDCHALILPGGAFASPKQYYRKGDAAKNGPDTSLRAEAYRECYHRALVLGIPILGICAGMQMIAGEQGGLLCSKVAEVCGGAIEHKSKERFAHEVNIVPGTLLYQVVKAKKLKVNSRHTECVAKINNLMKIGATAPDGCIEAIEVPDADILCVQWHPEDYVTEGDKQHLAIYQWLSDKARLYAEKC